MMKEEVEYLEQRIREHEESIARIRAAIEALSGPAVQVRSKSKRTSTHHKITPLGTWINEQSNREIILDCFNDGVPKRISDILLAMREAKGQDYKSKSLSPQVSALVGKDLEKHVIPSNPTETKYWYGLKSWFEDGVLKDEYKSKIT